MKIEEFSLRRKTAYKMWKEYKDACKLNPKDKFLLDMKKVYNQIKSGRKIIDIIRIFEASGLNEKKEPKLAIALASNEKIRMEYTNEGQITFRNLRRRYGYVSPENVTINNIFPPCPTEFWQGTYERYMLREAPVPKIPASLRPKGNLDDYYILWEVEQWKTIPAKDPYLLKRITPNMFVILAGWNLTELERAVMKGRMS